MRSFLDRLYNAAGALAAAGIVGITLLILAQILGRWMGIIVPSVEDFSGFLLAGSSLLGLAYTLRHGVHIRVNLVSQLLPPAVRRVTETTALAIATALSMWMAWYFVHLTLESYQFGETSYGYIPVQLWIPQLFPALGLVIFSIALLDDLVVTLRGGKPSYLVAEEADAAEINAEERL